MQSYYKCGVTKLVFHGNCMLTESDLNDLISVQQELLNNMAILNSVDNITVEDQLAIVSSLETQKSLLENKQK